MGRLYVLMHMAMCILSVELAFKLWQWLPCMTVIQEFRCACLHARASVSANASTPNCELNWRSVWPSVQAGMITWDAGSRDYSSRQSRGGVKEGQCESDQGILHFVYSMKIIMIRVGKMLIINEIR